MAYKAGEPKEEATIEIGVGNHILVHWLNTCFEFPPEGGINISHSCPPCHNIFRGNELTLWATLKSIKEK